LIFDVPKNELETIKTLIKSTMESVTKLSIPLVVEVGMGANWLEAH